MRPNCFFYSRIISSFSLYTIFRLINPRIWFPFAAAVPRCSDTFMSALIFNHIYSTNNVYNSVRNDTMNEKTSSLQFIYPCHLYGSSRQEYISSLQLLFLMSDLSLRSASGRSVNTRPSCSRAVVSRVGGH